MSHIDNRYRGRAGSRADVVAVDEGLRAYMLSVYTYMGAGVAVTGIVAYLIFTWSVTSDPALAASSGGQVIALHPGMYLTPVGQTIFATPLMWVIALAPLGFVFFLSWRVSKMSLAATRITFWLFAALMGASLSSIFLRFTAQSIAQVFFVTAAAFGALSLYGYATKRDLSGWGAFLFMGVIGIVIAALVNLFLQSSAVQFAISVIGVLVFAALTAYDTQRIKDIYYEVGGDMTATGKAAIMGALSLYLDFINMFVSLLQLFGNRE